MSTRPTPWQALQPHWQGLAARERQMVLAGAAALAILLLWWLAIQPVWRTWHEVPAQARALELQWLQMQQLASDARSLKGQPPVDAAQAATAMKAATDSLGGKARLSLLGDRATVTLTGISPEQLRSWLQEVRSAARGRAIQLSLRRADGGLSGTVVIALPGAV
jgi:general secretion pathway protein M